MHFKIDDLVRVKGESRSNFYNKIGKIKDTYYYTGREVYIIDFLDKIYGKNTYDIYYEFLELAKPVDMEKVCKKV